MSEAFIWILAIVAFFVLLFAFLPFLMPLCELYGKYCEWVWTRFEP